MIYAKVDVKLRDHVRAHKAGVAMSTWLWALLYVREQETDGLIPEIAIKLAWAGEKDARRHADALVVVGLWEVHEDGWRICRYDVKNETRAAVDERRKQVRERVSAHRRNSARNVGCNVLQPTSVTQATAPVVTTVTAVAVPGSGSGSGSGSDLREGESEREPDSGARYAAAYAAGITRGKCAPWVWPGTQYAEWDLGKIIKGHGIDGKQRPYRGDQLLRFIETTAAEFSSSVIESKKAQYYSAFEPRGCLKWLNEVDLAEEARRVG